jgi:TolA-binding protein
MTQMRRIRLAGVALAAVACQWVAVLPAHAEDSTVQEIRLRKIEAEVRALQRQVFPGGDGKMFTQDNGASANGTPGNAPGPQIGTPATTPVTDLLTRMDALEAQNARLTAQVEELSNHQRSAAAPAPVTPAATPVEVVVPQAAPAPTNLVDASAQPAAGKPAATKPAVTKPAATKPSAQRLAGVKAVIKPQTGDAGEDEYTYGYKLWEAKFYPEAEQQLKLYLDQYPKHKRISFARNLLGRAYLDEGKPREAAPWFLQNYQANKKGERAGDSLLLLAESMVQMKDTNRACIALGEFADGYHADATGRLRAQYEQTRSQVKCN